MNKRFLQDAFEPDPEILRALDISARNTRISAILRARRIRGNILDKDDLAQEGRMAVLKYAPRFDPSQGATLKTFLQTKVRSGISDALREADHLPRGTRTRISEHNKAIFQIRWEKQYTGPITPEVYAKHLGISVSEASKRLLEFGHGTVGIRNVRIQKTSPTAVGSSFDLLLQERLGETGGRFPTTDYPTEKDEIIELLHELINKLPERLRTVVHAFYFEGKLGKEIAAEMGVHPSRISQLLTQAKKSLAEKLRPALGMS
jgi:RNA polymerase sigma factor FliA